MGRPLRVTPGDAVYHVLNRANGRQALFEDEGDYAAFEHVLAKAQQWQPLLSRPYDIGDKPYALFVGRETNGALIAGLQRVENLLGSSD